MVQFARSSIESKRGPEAVDTSNPRSLASWLRPGQVSN